MAISKEDLHQLVERIEDPKELEAVYAAAKAIIDHDQAWYWSERWQREEREVDEWKANGQRTVPMSAEEALAEIDRIIEEGVQQDE